MSIHGSGEDDDDEPEPIEELMPWLEAPADSLGPVHVLSAWFGHPTREDLRVDVTERLREVARSDTSLRVSAANLGVSAGKRNGTVTYLKKLWVSCCYRWLDDAAEEVCIALAKKATQEMHPTDPRLVELQQKLVQPNGPLLWPTAEHQLQILQLQSAPSLAVEGLLYMSERRPRIFIQAAASTIHGFPLTYVACRAAQSLARALRLSSASASDGFANRCASKAEVRDFMQQCLRHGTLASIAAVFICVVLLDESRHVEEDILRTEALLEAARLAFCPLCLRPLVQFPDEAPAVELLVPWWMAGAEGSRAPCHWAEAGNF
eukprot:Skav217182  [mRNA]  locus=scaffold5232:78045:81053:+ [translate_table: standard]